MQFDQVDCRMKDSVSCVFRDIIVFDIDPPFKAAAMNRAEHDKDSMEPREACETID